MKTKNKSKLWLGILIGITVAACFCAVALLIPSVRDLVFPEPVVEYVEVVSPTPTPIVETVTVYKEPEFEDFGFEEIGELATETAYYTEVLSVENFKKFFVWDNALTKHAYVLAIDGTVKAGYDFSSIHYDINHTFKTIAIILPPCRVLSNELDLDSVRVYSEKNNIFNPINVEEALEAANEIKQNAEKHAKDRGLMTEARKNAELIISNICHTFLPDYAVVFM